LEVGLFLKGRGRKRPFLNYLNFLIFGGLGSGKVIPGEFFIIETCVLKPCIFGKELFGLGALGGPQIREGLGPKNIFLAGGIRV